MIKGLAPHFRLGAPVAEWRLRQPEVPCRRLPEGDCAADTTYRPPAPLPDLGLAGPGG